MKKLTGIKGRIMRGIAGFYYVDAAESGFFTGWYACKAKGIFRKAGITPLVGDRVLFDITDEKDMEGNITEILPRKNALVRPAAANVDQGLLVFAFEDPAPNRFLLDRFLVDMQRLGIPVMLCFNKGDLDQDGVLENELSEIYRNCGCRLLFASAARGEGIDEIKRLLAGKLTVLAGPSGVGKSSIVNSLQSGTYMETGQTSKKLKRGRHTTRRAELIAVGEDSYIMDTPGFSSLFLSDMAKEDLQLYYPEFEPYRDACRFLGCQHMNEPDCAVKEAVEAGRIHPKRYETYRALYEELAEAEKKRYR